MKQREIVDAQLHHRETESIPFTLHFEEPLLHKVDQALNTSDWQKGIKSSVITVGCFDTWDTLQPAGEGKLRDAYGSIWKQTEDIAHLEIPVLTHIPLEEYKFPEIGDFCSDDRLKQMLFQLDQNADLYPVGMIGAGIYELTWRLLGVEETLMDMLAGPERIHAIFRRLTDLLHQFIDRICELPVEAVMLGDDWADQRSIIFGARRWREMVAPYLKELYEHIHARGKLTVTHSCGSVREVIPDLIDMGLDVLESVQPEAAGMSPFQLKREFGRDLAFWGGLGCQRTVTFGTPDELREEIRRLRREMSIGGGYILAPTKTLNASIPVENALALLDELNHPQT